MIPNMIQSCTTNNVSKMSDSKFKVGTRYCGYRLNLGNEDMPVILNKS